MKHKHAHHAAHHAPQVNEDGKAFNGDYRPVILAAAITATMLAYAFYVMAVGVFEAIFK